MQTLEEKKAIFLEYLKKDSIRLQKIKKRIEDSNNDIDEDDIIKLNDIVRKTCYHESYYDYMRENKEEDLEERRNILRTYTEKIDKSIPDGVPLVFHGTNNIGIVHEILKSGGLMTPEERSVSMTSYASQIDTTYKKYIHTSLEFAEPGENSYMPYGAIFAFFPEEDEISKVLKTGNSSEVSEGVKGVNFRERKERLFGIITTKENIERVKKWCLEYNIPDKVYTHEEFINMCQNYDFAPIIEKSENYLSNSK